MIVINIKINDYQMGRVFPFAIRTKLDYLLVLFNFLNLIESYPYARESECDGAHFLVVVKHDMSRFFIVKERQITSGFVPLNIQIVNDNLYIKLQDFSLDFAIIRILQIILSELRYQEDMYGQLTLSDIIGITDNCLDDSFSEDDLSDEVRIKIHATLSHLLYCEDSYFRYDIDDVNENGIIHPLHHFDIFYSNLSTFKLGLNTHHNVQNILDILDKESGCSYLL